MAASEKLIFKFLSVLRYFGYQIVPIRFASTTVISVLKFLTVCKYQIGMVILSPYVIRIAFLSQLFKSCLLNSKIGSVKPPLFFPSENAHFAESINLRFRYASAKLPQI